jgi:hypothetical protein
MLEAISQVQCDLTFESILANLDKAMSHDSSLISITNREK